MTPTTVIVFTCQCIVRVVVNGACRNCGEPVRPTTLVERREIRAFEVIRTGPPPTPPWAREKRQRMTRPGRR